MSKNKEAIIARLDNREGVNFFPGKRRKSPKGYVVTRSGAVCPLETLNQHDFLHPIYIEDGQLYCDEKYGATNTEFEVNGNNDLKAAVGRYNERIDAKLREGETEDDDSSKIVKFRAF